MFLSPKTDVSKKEESSTTLVLKTKSIDSEVGTGDDGRISIILEMEPGGGLMSIGSSACNAMVFFD